MRQPSRKIFDPERYKAATGEDAVAGRLSGRLPMIEIDKHLFFVEIRLGLLRPMDIFSTMGINIETGSVETNDGRHRLFFYNRNSFEDADLDMVSPKDRIALVRIPRPLDLDPIMTAQLQGYPDRHYLEEHPMVMYRVAEMIPITPELVRKVGGSEKLWDNVERIFKEEMKKQQKLPPKKKGKGL